MPVGMPLSVTELTKMIKEKQTCERGPRRRIRKWGEGGAAGWEREIDMPEAGESSVVPG